MNRLEEVVEKAKAADATGAYEPGNAYGCDQAHDELLEECSPKFIREMAEALLEAKNALDIASFCVAACEPEEHADETFGIVGKAIARIEALERG